MGILIKKRQQGGSIYADPKYLKLNADIPMQQGSSGSRGTYGNQGNNASTKIKEEKPEDLEGFLPSDIQWYDNAKASIAEAIANGLKKNSDFDHTPEYEMLIKQRYNLEELQSQKMKNMATTYKDAATKFRAKDAGDSPAILNGRAIVSTIIEDPKTHQKVEQYGLVTEDELLKNADKYNLLTTQDILSKRASNAAFSGFTELGDAANQLIDIAYGSKKYDEDIITKLSDIGYTSNGNSFISSITNQDLNLDTFEFDPTKLVTIPKDDDNIKTNLGNIITIYNELKSGSTNLTDYIKNKAIGQLHEKIAKKEIVIDDKENSTDMLISKGIASELITKLKSKLNIERSEANKKNGTGSDGSKTIKENVVSSAILQLLENTQRITVKNIASTDPTTADLISITPAAYVTKGNALLNTGYSNKDPMSKDNRKTLKNNTLLQDVQGGKTLMTTYDGTPLEAILDNGDLNNAIISENPGLHIVLAPTVEENGKIKVNFTNEFTPKMAQAIKLTYDELGKKGISQTDIAKKGQAGIQEVEKIAQKYLKELLGNNIENPPVIRACFAFNANIEVDSEFSDKPQYGWDISSDLIDQGGDADTRLFGLLGHTTKETVVFIPISNAFWTEALKPGTFDSYFETEVPRDKYGAITKSRPTINNMNLDVLNKFISAKTYENRNKPIKRHGGKLHSAEELRILLFN